MTKIGDYIKNARIEKGYTIRKLAKLSGVNYSLLSKIEAGKTQNPHLRFIKALCRYLDITYGDCLYIMELGASYNPNNDGSLTVKYGNENFNAFVGLFAFSQ